MFLCQRSGIDVATSMLLSSRLTQSMTRRLFANRFLVIVQPGHSQLPSRVPQLRCPPCPSLLPPCYLLPPRHRKNNSKCTTNPSKKAPCTHPFYNTSYRPIENATHPETPRRRPRVPPLTVSGWSSWSRGMAWKGEECDEKGRRGGEKEVQGDALFFSDAFVGRLLSRWVYRVCICSCLWSVG